MFNHIFKTWFYDVIVFLVECYCCGYISLLLRKFFCQNLIFAWRIWELNKERNIYESVSNKDEINNTEQKIKTCVFLKIIAYQILLSVHEIYH